MTTRRPVRIELSGVAWSHLRSTSPGSLGDDQLGDWGYEPDGVGPEFVRACRDAVRSPVYRRRRGRGESVTIELPTIEHARALTYKLRDVGDDFARGGGYDPETAAEGRALLRAAERAEAQLKTTEGERK